MIIKRKQFDVANKVYWDYEYTLQDLERQLEKLPKESWCKAFRKELEHKIDCYKLAVKALEEFKIKLGLMDKSGLILVDD